VIKTQEQYYCTVELNGSLTRGMMVVDKGKVVNKPPNAAVITEIDRDLYESMLLAAVGGTRRSTKPNRTYRQYKNSQRT
jgi:inosine-uridine nucleoside N-ribohydrolase